MTDIASIQAYVPSIRLTEILPLLVLLVGAMLCLVADAATNRDGSRRILPLISGGTLLLAMLTFLPGFMPEVPFLETTFNAPGYIQLSALVMLFSAFVMVVLGPEAVRRRNLPSGEYYTLVLFAALGMVLLGISNELVTAFISLEIMSLSLYVLTGLDRRSARASEASFKYFILGSFASAFLVFGIAFLFGATGTTRLNEMAEILAAGVVIGPAGVEEAINPFWLFLGFALVLVGISFKLSLAPFHMWAPDVYEGANTPTTIAIATGSKVAGFLLFMNITLALAEWDPFGAASAFIIGLLAVASMLWGNLAALVQTDIKRMLAYSSVAHTGYLTVGILVLAALPGLYEDGALLELRRDTVIQAIVLYLAGYTVMNVLALGIAFYIHGEGDMKAYRGLFYRRRVPAIGMAVAMFSLVGIGFTPPTIGFMGKFYLFKEAVQDGFILMAVIAVLASVISAFYYLGLVVSMFMTEREDELPEGMGLAGAAPVSLASQNVLTRVVLMTCAVLIFVFGLLPTMFISFASVLEAGLIAF